MINHGFSQEHPPCTLVCALKKGKGRTERKANAPTLTSSVSGKVSGAEEEARH